MAEIKQGNRQTAINMVSTILSYGISLGISFFLTPYIVAKLGAAAYGFLGLSNNIIGYTSLFTVAINSMSGRFISEKYHRGDFDGANRYLSSTVVANCAMACFIVVVFGIITFFLEDLIDIPAEQVQDVKFLFTILYVNAAISLCTSFLWMGFFLKNRLELNNAFEIFRNLLRVLLIILAYGLMPAQLWYLGGAGIICTLFSIVVNRYFYHRLTPELHFRKKLYDFRRVWEMTKEGAWNVLTQLSSILNQGLELLLANIFVSAYYMGILSISKTVPFLLLGIFAALGNNFHPECMLLYAQGNKEGMQHLLVKGIRLMGALAAIPCAGVLAFGDIFYAAWLPGQDYQLVYVLSVITMVWLLTTLPTQTLWYIFTMTKTVRHSSLVLIRYGIANAVLIIIAVNLLDDNLHKIFAIVAIQSVLGILRFMTFLPFYGAKVLGLPRYTFLKPLSMCILSCAVVTALCMGFKYLFISSYDWEAFIICAVFTIAVGMLINLFFILTKDDRNFIYARILKIIKA